MDAPEIEKFVGDLEVAVDRLRSLYEQYFMGIEKLEPTVPRKDVDRRIQVMRKEQIRNTAMRFRFQMILQRYNTYQTHWQRICREIENGTYKRHVVRAQRRFASVPPPPMAAPQLAAASPEVLAPPPPLAMPGILPTGDLAAELASLEDDFGPLQGAPAAPARKPGPIWRKAEPAGPRAATPVPPARDADPPGQTRHISRPPPPLPPRAAPVNPSVPPAPRAPGVPPPVPPRAAAARPLTAAPPAAPPAAPVARPPQPSAGDIPDERVRQLYAQYVDAKRQLKESTATITYDAVARSLRDSSAKLREKHGKAVDFEVSVKDGKAILKPVLK